MGGAFVGCLFTCRCLVGRMIWPSLDLLQSPVKRRQRLHVWAGAESAGSRGACFLIGR